MATEPLKKPETSNNASGIKNVQTAANDNYSWLLGESDENEPTSSRAANDNQPPGRDSSMRNVRRVTTPGNTRSRRLPPIKINKEEDSSKRVFRDWKLFGFVVALTTKIYILQLIFATFTLMGLIIALGLESNWLIGAADFIAGGSIQAVGIFLLVTGMAVCFLLGLVTFSVAFSRYFSAYSLQGNETGLMRPGSAAVLAVCSVGLLCPVINFFPLMWGWCLYVTLTHNQS